MPNALFVCLLCAALTASVVLAALLCAALRCAALPCAVSTGHAGWRRLALVGTLLPPPEAGSGISRELFFLERAAQGYCLSFYRIPLTCSPFSLEYRAKGRANPGAKRRANPSQGGNFPSRCSFAKTSLPTGQQCRDGWPGDWIRHGGRSTGLLAGAEGGKERLQRRLLTRDAGTRGIVLLMGEPQCSSIETERIF
jgi:hypothetical protein